MLNIPSSVDDPSYRYKMPRIISRKEGRGNGSKTGILNMGDVARALKRDPVYITKFLGYDLGAQSSYTNKENEGERVVINGHHETHVFQDLVDKFIQKYVLCVGCNLPEIDMIVKKGIIVAQCKACGWAGELDNQHKLAGYISKNRPGTGIVLEDEGGDWIKSRREREREQAEKVKQKQEKGDDVDDDADGDDGDEKEKKEKKEKKEAEEGQHGSPTMDPAQDRRRSVLDARADAMFKETERLATALHEQEGATRACRAELAACRAELAACQARLSSTEARAEEAWRRLSDAERALAEALRDNQRLADQAAYAEGSPA